MPFNFGDMIEAVEAAIPPDRVALAHGDAVIDWGTLRARSNALARAMLAAGLQPGERVGFFAHNSADYLLALMACWKARGTHVNINYRYVAGELASILDDSDAAVLFYDPRLRDCVAAVANTAAVRQWIEFGDTPGRPAFAASMRDLCAGDPAPLALARDPQEQFFIYTGGTTGMPKGVLWRQHDIFLSSMGGRPFGAENFLSSYEELADKARASAGAMSMLMIPPFMHGAAQWASYTAITMGGKLVIPDDVVRLRPDAALRLAERERVMSIPVVGDAIARPLIDEIEGGNYDLSGLVTISNGGAPLSPTVRSRILAALPHLLLLDAVGASESGAQMSAYTTSGAETQPATFTPQPDTAVVSEDLTRVLGPGEGGGWLARRDLIPLGYLGDAEKTARTFPTVDGVRWSVPGDRANVLPDGRIQLLGRDSVTINSGGEKIFVEEVERAIAAHPAVYDVVVVGRPSERWGSEVVAIVQFAEGASATDDELVEVCERSIARYKIPKAFIRSPEIVRSPAGKADYRWAKQIATEAVST